MDGVRGQAIARDHDEVAMSLGCGHSKLTSNLVTLLWYREMELSGGNGTRPRCTQALTHAAMHVD